MLKLQACLALCGAGDRSKYPYAWTVSTVLSEVHSQALEVLFKFQFSTFTDESKKVNNDKNFRNFITFIRDVDMLPI